ncbi:MAG: hypothetical protein JWN70_6400 [Planctomycetaceae bacterium]|nr:hypothetical protein [Planctomycetaceae bacterium]
MPRKPIDSFKAALAPESSHIRFGRVAIPISLICCVWGLIMVGGVGVIANYQWRPAPSGQTPERWPNSASIASPAGKPVLLMFLHPHCPCSRASLAELTRLMAQVRGKATIQLLFFASEQFEQPAGECPLWKKAITIPDVQVDRDIDGVLARQFGAYSSGKVLLYDRTGQLQFAGGITAGRGHGGDNPGARAIVGALNGQRVLQRSYPVFGCPISAISDEEKGPVR